MKVLLNSFRKILIQSSKNQEFPEKLVGLYSSLKHKLKIHFLEPFIHQKQLFDSK